MGVLAAHPRTRRGRIGGIYLKRLAIAGANVYRSSSGVPGPTKAR